jgi:hypothetical protein
VAVSPLVPDPSAAAVAVVAGRLAVAASVEADTAALAVVAALAAATAAAVAAEADTGDSRPLVSGRCSGLRFG